ncbi:MAG TPA: BMP family protein [Leptolyngbyaceae cyanobacterium]
MSKLNRKSFSFFILPVTIALLFGCNTPQNTQNSASPTAKQKPENTLSSVSQTNQQKLALVFGGPANDDSWNEAAYNAAQALKEKGVNVAISESVADADVARVLRQYAEQGYTLVVGHSYNHGDAVFQVAKEFPNINFAWAGSVGKTAPNVADYGQPFYQGAYLVGLVAGKLTKTGKLGAIYGFDIPACRAMGQAMLLAAKTIRPDATLTATAAGDWYDIAKAKEAGIAQAETGVDYWIGCGQGPSLGTIEAAKAKGGYATSYVGDMSDLGLNVVAANLLWNMEPIFNQMLNDIGNNQFANKYYQLSIKEDVIQVKTTPLVKDKVGNDTLTKLEETKQEIANGKLKVPFIPK